jgi:uncharacterized protein
MLVKCLRQNFQGETLIIEEELNYLKMVDCPESVIQHSIAVAKEAMKIADIVVINVDRKLILKGAVNHDIGRSKTHELDHFVVGAEIAAELGMDEDVVLIIERHIGAGIPKEEAVTCGFPARDFIPLTPEEIIVSYADNLVDHVTAISFQQALDKFRASLGNTHPAIKRFILMHEKVQSWMNE